MKSTEIKINSKVRFMCGTTGKEEVGVVTRFLAIKEGYRDEVRVGISAPHLHKPGSAGEAYNVGWVMKLSEVVAVEE